MIDEDGSGTIKELQVRESVLPLALLLPLSVCDCIDRALLLRLPFVLVRSLCTRHDIAKRVSPLRALLLSTLAASV